MWRTERRSDDDDSTTWMKSLFRAVQDLPTGIRGTLYKDPGSLILSSVFCQLGPDDFVLGVRRWNALVRGSGSITNDELQTVMNGLDKMGMHVMMVGSVETVETELRERLMALTTRPQPEWPEFVLVLLRTGPSQRVENVIWKEQRILSMQDAQTILGFTGRRLRQAGGRLSLFLSHHELEYTDAEVTQLTYRNIDPKGTTRVFYIIKPCGGVDKAEAFYLSTGTSNVGEENMPHTCFPTSGYTVLSDKRPWIEKKHPCPRFLEKQPCDPDHWSTMLMNRFSDQRAFLYLLLQRFRDFHQVQGSAQLALRTCTWFRHPDLKDFVLTHDWTGAGFRRRTNPLVVFTTPEGSHVRATQELDYDCRDRQDEDKHSVYPQIPCLQHVNQILAQKQAITGEDLEARNRKLDAACNVM